jgi:long-chain acyl-CoA synthetase
MENNYPALTNRLTIPSMLASSVEKYGDRPAVALYGERALNYRELDTSVASVRMMLTGLDVRKGDPVAILGANTPEWVISFLAITSMGAIAVPLLPDFSRDEITNIISHSGCRHIFVTGNLQPKLPAGKQLVILPMETLLHHGTGEAAAADDQNPRQDFSSEAGNSALEINENDTISIIYTSGTTGKSKGVVLSHRNVLWTAQKSGLIQPVDSADRFLSILPLSHTYENTLGLILPLMYGAFITYLGKAPSPSILLPALKEVKPTIMLTVPLLMEKIFRKQVRDRFTKHLLSRVLYNILPLRIVLHRLAGKKLLATFGGHLKFFGIGGAKLDRETEKFLREARFPYAIGYGLTETAPLLAGSAPFKTRLQAAGPAMDGVSIRIENPDRFTGIGEVVVKGDNVMKGYYKEPELTRKVLTDNGWLKTGDLGYLDSKNYLHLKGRLKNVILGASGENIYPEDIESIINNIKYVMESLVIQQKGKLVALVHLNMEELEEKLSNFRSEAAHQINEKIDYLLDEIKIYVNERVNKSSRLQAVILQPDPFERTPTLKIKRYLY